MYGKRYGTPRKPVEEGLAARRLVILEIDVQGAKQVKGKIPGALAMFVPNSTSARTGLKVCQMICTEDVVVFWTYGPRMTLASNSALKAMLKSESGGPLPSAWTASMLVPGRSNPLAPVSGMSSAAPRG